MSVTEWLMLLTSYHLPVGVHRCRLEPRNRIWILLYEKAIQLAYGTSVVLLWWPLMIEIIQTMAPDASLQQ
jgi:hypothetical protein